MANGTSRLRFSLRALLAVVTLLAVLLAWGVQRARRQSQAFTELARNGYYELTYRSAQGPQSAGEEYLANGWLATIAGHDWFAKELSVVVDNTGRRISDKELAALASLPNLRWVSYTAETDDVERLRDTLPHCEIRQTSFAPRPMFDIEIAPALR